MFFHEPIISSSTPDSRGTAGVAEIAPLPQKRSRSLQAFPLNLAAGSGIQHQRCQPNSQPPLYERPQVGEKVSSRRPPRAPGPETTRPPATSRGRYRNLGYPNSYLSTARARIRLYDLVFGQTREILCSTSPGRIYQPRDDTADSFPSRSSLFDRTNVVRKRRSRIRGKLVPTTAGEEEKSKMHVI